MPNSFAAKMTHTRSADHIEKREASEGPTACPTTSTRAVVRESQTGPSSSPCSLSGDMAHEAENNNETVRLISSEGKILDIPVRIAKECELLERMLLGTFAESRTREFSLPNIRHRTLCKAINYLRRRCQWKEGGGAPLEFEVDDDIAVELLIAADFLGMK